MLANYYFPWKNDLSISLHFDKLKRLVPGLKSSFHAIEGDEIVIRSRSTIQYMVAHSDRNRGIILKNNNMLSAQAFSKRFIPSGLYAPRLSFINTCHGIDSGLAKAVLKAGAKTVIAASGPIPIKYMTEYAECFFGYWVESKSSISNTLQVANEKFKEKRIRFTYLGNGKMTFESLMKCHGYFKT